MDLSLNLQGDRFAAPDSDEGRQGPRGGDGSPAQFAADLPTYIFKGEVHEIKDVMKKSRELGMQTFDQSLFDSVRGRPHQLRRRAAQRRLVPTTCA
jgi:Tfp pilus assembly ATPase PilU